MDLKSSFFAESMNVQCKDILTEPMLEMISELTANAVFIMNTDIDSSGTSRSTGTIVHILKNQKYKYMPFHLVCEGFTKGSMGELGGTTRFTVRNVCVWMNAMYEKLAQINTMLKTREDAERRASDAKTYKLTRNTSISYGSAMSRKMEWAKAGLLTSTGYDRCTLEKIVGAVKSGYTLNELQPNMIL